MRDIPVEQLAKLFQPFSFGEGALRNRIVMAPMTRCFCPQGVPGPEVAKYYARRASGGAGLLITEGTYIDHPAANGYRDVPAFFGSALGGWSQVVQSVHGQGALIVPQLWHVGPVRRPAMGPVIGVPGVGPQAVWEDGALVVESMTRQAIGEVIGSFARAARAARECGFDGVEIHGAHGYLLDEFLWDQSNRRTDEYGGSLENRARLSLEVVDAIRQAAGPGFPIIFRFSQWKMGDYQARIAQSPQELSAVLRPLAAAGVDIFHVSTRRFWEPAFEGSDESLAACTRRVTGKPVIAVGSIGMAQQHESRRMETRSDRSSDVANMDKLLDGLARDDFDLVAVGRGMLADPDWANKVRSGAVSQLNKLTEEALQTLW